MADFKPVTLYKGDCTYLCETEERLERFTADGWSKNKPRAKKAAAKPESDSEE